MTITPLVRPPLSTLAEYPSLGDSIEFQLTGLAVVFLALSSIWGVMELIGLFFRRRKVVVRSAVVAVAEASVPAATAGGELVVVIAAAVAQVVGVRHRIQAIAPAGENLDWAREGRRAIFASHQTR